MKTRTTRIQRKATGYCLLILAAVFAVISLDSVPPRTELMTLEGLLDEVIPATPGNAGLPTRFRITGDGRLLQYHSKAGDMGLVEQALVRSAQQPVRVLVDSADEFSTVYELAIDGHTIRSYDEVTAAWQSNNMFSRWIAWVSALTSVVVLFRAYWK